MTEFSVTRDIDAPVDVIWSIVGEPRLAVYWYPSALERRVVTPGPIRRGTVIRHSDRILGRILEQAHEIVEYVPNDRYRGRTVGGPFTYEYGLYLTPVGSRTRVTVTAAAASGFAGFFGWFTDAVVTGASRRQLESALRQLQLGVENGTLTPDLVFSSESA